MTPGQRLGLHLTTEYPWQGRIRLEITETSGSSWELSLRIPEWSPRASVSVNGQELDTLTMRNGYIILERAWQSGDVVDLDLAMEPMLVASNPRVDANRASVAIQRGPLVYCLEDCDQEVQGRLLDVEIDPGRPLQAPWEENLLGGVMVVQAEARFIDRLPPFLTWRLARRGSWPSRILPGAIEASAA